jgi:FeS assembly SUF system regulator
MLRISKMADYATLILNCLSANTESLLSANEIARRVHLGRHTVSKILKILQEADLVVSTRGAIGGYSLARTPDEITIAEIITALEGPLALTECSDSTQVCTQNMTCAVKHNWRAINQFVLATLESITLADMLKPILTEHLLKTPSPPDQKHFGGRLYPLPKKGEEKKSKNAEIKHVN